MILGRLVLAAVLFGIGTPVAGAQALQSNSRAATDSPRKTLKKFLFAALREPKLAAVDIFTFRRPAYTLSMLADLAAIGVDAAATSELVAQCRSCSESGTWRLFIGSRPTPHKVFLMGAGEALFTMTASHYALRTSHYLPVRVAAEALPAAQAAVHAYYGGKNWNLLSRCKSAGLNCH